MDLREFLIGLGAQVAGNVETNNPTVDAYMHAAARIMQHAGKWAAVSASGISCSLHLRNQLGEVRPCGTAAIAACVVCHQPTCFQHAMISPADGNVVCFGCIAAAQRSLRSGRPLRDEEPSEPGEQCICRDPAQLDPSCPVHGQTARREHREAPERSELRRKHLRRLGLGTSANWAEIRASYRRMASQNHPDRFPAAQKKRQESKLKKLNEAFEWLKRDEQRQAA